MKTIFLVCRPGRTDSALVALIGASLRSGEQLVLWHPEQSLPPVSENAGHLFVADCRDEDQTTVAAEFTRIREALGPERRLVVVASGGMNGRVDIESRIRGSVTGLILWKTEPLVHAIRAELNDPSKAGAAAIALSVLLDCLPPETHPVITEVLGNSGRVTLVKQVAAAWGADRGTPNRHVSEAINFSARKTVKFSKASMAAILLRESATPISGIAKLLGYARRKQFDKLLVDVFAMSAQEIRAERGEKDPARWLELKLREVL